MTLLDSIGVMLIGFIWQHVGALQNPLFLTVFALPVIGAIFLSRWHPYFIAALSVVVVAIVSLSQVPELRWYASGLIGNENWLTELFGRQAAAAPPPSFSGFYAPSSYLMVLLEVFAILLVRLRGGRRIRRHDFRAPARAHRHGAYRGGARPGTVGEPGRTAASAGPADRSGYPADHRHQ